MTKVLAVDDDPKICLLYENMLAQMDFSYEIATTIEKARTLFESGEFDLILLDLELPDGNGLDLLPEFKAKQNSPEVIIITGTGDTRGAELAFKYGAWDYVPKPFMLSEISLPIMRAVEYRQEKLEKAIPVTLDRTAIVGESLAIKRSLEELGKAAITDASVLISGETGTGKELFAKAIHANSKRAANPFIVVDCAALPESLLESTLFGHEKGSFTGAERKQMGLLIQADGGTLMLDEIGDLPLSAQKSFLRALQERKIRPIGGKSEIPFDVRLVAATNLDLQQMVHEGTFRQDLFYRIKAMEIILPPLRDRESDVEEIAHKKIYELSNKYGMLAKAVSPEFFKLLAKYKWPGNVRELLNVLEYALASAGNDPTLFPKHLPPELRVSDLGLKDDSSISDDLFLSSGLNRKEELPTLNDYRHSLEREYLKELIWRSGGDRRAACKMSGISQSRLYGLLSKYGLPGFSSS
jgi:two-component system, NtrC family, response regulator